MITATPQVYAPDAESDLIGFRIAYHDSPSDGVVSNETFVGVVVAVVCIAALAWWLLAPAAELGSSAGLEMRI